MKICIDAGHYGKYNQSPVNKAYWESEMTWKLHILLKSELEKYGVTVVATRPNQATDLALTSRGKKAAGCDLFISIHSNACGQESVDYPLACCCVSGKCDALGQKLADTVQRVMGCKQSGRIIKKKNTAGNGDWYSVLYGAAQVGVPGVLLENGFHTNAANTAWLLNDVNLAKLAQAEAQTIAEHYGLKKFENNSHIQQAMPEKSQTNADGAFRVKVVCNALNVRSGAGTQYKINTVVHKNEVYTIVGTTKSSDGGMWYKLKSGVGYINGSTKYVRKV